MPTEKFHRDDLQKLVYEEETENLIVVEDTIIDNGRWSIYHYLIFKDKTTGKFYRSGYSVGATEQQDECAYDRYTTPELVKCQEVYPKQVNAVQWRDVDD